MKIFSVLSAILLAGMHHAAVPQWSVYGPRNVMMAQQTAENITQIAFNPKLAAPGEYWCGARLAFKSPIKEKVMTFSVKGSVIRRLNFKVTSSNKRVVNRQVMVFQEWEEVKLDLTDMINDISTIDIIFMVEGVLSFYAQFKRVKPGRFKIAVCDGTACHIKGSSQVGTWIQQELGIRDGETDKEGRFSLETVACLGCCSLAPVMSINGRVFGKLDRRTMSKILKEYREK